MFTLFIFSLLALSGMLFAFRYNKLAGNVFLISLLIFWVSGSSLVPYVFTQNLQSEFPVSSNISWKDKNTIILLGGGTFKNSHTAQVSPRPLSYSRIYEAARLYESCEAAEKNCQIIISGGDITNNGITEAESYKQTLLSLGVPNNAIRTENKSENTWQNAIYVSMALKEINSDQVILVTSGLHMERALLYFRHFGLDPIPAASDYYKPIVSVAPIGHNLALSDKAVHEYADMFRYHVYNWLGLNG